MKYNEYLLRTYDTFFQDVRKERVSKFVDDIAAINAAKSQLYMLHTEKDTVEIQVCRKGLGMGTWVMFAAVSYDYDGSILVDDCFC